MKVLHAWTVKKIEERKTNYSNYLNYASFPFTYSPVSQNNKHVASRECQNDMVSTQLTVHACDMITHLKLR